MAKYHYLIILSPNILNLVTLFLHENVQTEAVSIQFAHFDANRGHFYSEFR